MTGITIEAAQLARAMKNAAAIVQPRNTIPILANVRLIAQGNSLELTTSDLDIEYRQTVPLAGAGDLATTVDARRLAALAGAVEPGAQIALALEDASRTGGRLVVKSGRSRWVLPVIGVDDFPVMIAAEGGTGLDIPAADLGPAIDRVVWSVSDEENRYYLLGIFFNCSADKLHLAATNGHTLMTLTTAHAWPQEAPAIIVPTRLCHTLSRLAAEHKGEIALRWTDKQLRADFGDIVVTGKTIDGQFPDYDRVIPAEGKATTLAPADLRGAIRRVQLVSSEKTRTVKVERGKDGLLLGMASAEGSSAAEQVAADCQDDGETGFNVRYLDQMAEHIGGDTIEIHQQDADAPALFRRVVPDGALGVVMPMRI